MNKWQDQGFWKSLIFYRLSVINYWIKSIRYFNFTWYEAANPAIEHGGMLNEKKSKIYPLLNQKYLPKTEFFAYDSDPNIFITKNNFVFPIIIKPDVGLKGIEVTKVYEIRDSIKILNQIDERGAIVQEYINLPKEYSVLYYKYEDGNHGISSFIEKKYPEIIGDGIKDIYTLIDEFQHPYLNKMDVKSMHKNRVLNNGEQLILHNIGNYSRGSTFHSLQEAIDERLISSIHNCIGNIKGISFGRLDIKAEGLEAVRNGNFKIIEFNGGKSEPLHMYDCKVSIWKTIKIIFNHWKTYNRIADERLKKGYETIPTAEGVRALRNIKSIAKKKK